MKVSVIIPVYNVERYLVRCLDSVLAAAGRLTADGHSAEIICVNDGSTDGCAEILERYRSTFSLQPSTFLVLTKENGGLGSARNAGLDAMTGDVVTFVDSDDWIPSHALASFLAVAKASGAALVVSLSFAKSNGQSVSPPRVTGARPATTDWRRRGTPWIAGKRTQYSACNKLYAAELFASRRFPATIYEDFPVTTDIFCEVGSFAAIDEPLYVYCTNEGAASLVRSSFTERKLRDSVAVVRMVLETARRQQNPALRAFALRQAASGHSSTVGQVYKAKDPRLMRMFVECHNELLREFPELRRRMSLKARFRLLMMTRA